MVEPSFPEAMRSIIKKNLIKEIAFNKHRDCHLGKWNLQGKQQAFIPAAWGQKCLTRLATEQASAGDREARLKEFGWKRKTVSLGCSVQKIRKIWPRDQWISGLTAEEERQRGGVSLNVSVRSFHCKWLKPNWNRANSLLYQVNSSSLTSKI